MEGRGRLSVDVIRPPTRDMSESNSVKNANRKMMMSLGKRGWYLNNKICISQENVSVGGFSILRCFESERKRRTYV